METTISKSFLDSGIYQNPQEAFDEVIARLNLGEEVTAYLNQVLCSDNFKDDLYQEAIRPILEALLKQGKKKEAGLLFNIHRTLTEFRGYGANDKASNDVAACFGNDFEIPEQGLIVVDFFVTRNLPAIVKICEERQVDLSRIRVCVPKAILAAQLMQMSEEKKAEFEGLCSKLQENQFVIGDVNHNADIALDGDVAIWFSPRTMPITPRLHAETEEDTITNYCDWFKERVSNVVTGGSLYANLAYSEEWQPLGVEVTEGQRKLAKLTGMSRSVAAKIAELLVDELNFSQLGKAVFRPADVDPEIDHAKLAKELHVVKG
ncbi:hypothetical protein KKG71_03355 [Patescibacteria group bacterium]|nr:hypothetical protein [Patescibacteria group bacterium]